MKNLVGGVFLYFKLCKNCGVQIAVPLDEWVLLPLDTDPK